MPDADTLTPLILDLVEWLAAKPRPEDEVLNAWRTSCPRLPVWEEALERGLVTRRHAVEGGLMVAATEAGFEFLRAHGRFASASLRLRNGSPRAVF